MSARRYAALLGAAGLSIFGAAAAGNAQSVGPADNRPIPLYSKPVDSVTRPVIREPVPTRSAAPAETKRSPETIAKYLGATVINAAGKQVGRVEDFVTEADGDDSITYAVVGIGKELALGARKVTIPASRLRLKGDRLKLVAGGSQAELNALPDYEASQYRSVAHDAAPRRQGAPVTPAPLDDLTDLAGR